MLCKRCMTIMRTGTTYEPKKDGNGQTSKRFSQCPKCHEKIYKNSFNFQETLVREFDKRRSK